MKKVTMRSILKKIVVRKKYKEHIEAASIPQTFEWQPTFLSTRLTSSTDACTLALRLYYVVNLHCNWVTKENARIQWSKSHYGKVRTAIVWLCIVGSNVCWRPLAAGVGLQ